mgnify:CR=1 FL=1
MEASSNHNNNWLACFEVVSQTNNKVERDEKFFFQKKEEEPQTKQVDGSSNIDDGPKPPAFHLDRISEGEYERLEGERRQADLEATEVIENDR